MELWSKSQVFWGIAPSLKRVTWKSDKPPTQDNQVHLGLPFSPPQAPKNRKGTTTFTLGFHDGQEVLPRQARLFHCLWGTTGPLPHKATDPQTKDHKCQLEADRLRLRQRQQHPNPSPGSGSFSPQLDRWAPATAPSRPFLRLLSPVRMPVMRPHWKSSVNRRLRLQVRLPSRVPHAWNVHRPCQLSIVCLSELAASGLLWTDSLLSEHHQWPEKSRESACLSPRRDSFSWGFYLSLSPVCFVAWGPTYSRGGPRGQIGGRMLSGDRRQDHSRGTSLGTFLPGLKTGP